MICFEAEGRSAPSPHTCNCCAAKLDGRQPYTYLLRPQPWTHCCQSVDFSVYEVWVTWPAGLGACASHVQCNVWEEGSRQMQARRHSLAACCWGLQTHKHSFICSNLPAQQCDCLSCSLKIERLLWLQRLKWMQHGTPWC